MNTEIPIELSAYFETERKCGYYDCIGGNAKPTRVMFGEGFSKPIFYWTHKRCHAEFCEDKTPSLTIHQAIRLLREIRSNTDDKWPEFFRKAMLPGPHTLDEWIELLAEGEGKP